VADEMTREELMDVLEAMLEGQLRALRSLRGRSAPLRRRRDGRKSNMIIVFDVLSEKGAPLHINDIIRVAAETHGTVLKRESLVSALTKKVLDRQTFCRVGPNRFGLLARDGGSAHE